MVVVEIFVCGNFKMCFKVKIFWVCMYILNKVNKNKIKYSKKGRGCIVYV